MILHFLAVASHIPTDDYIFPTNAEFFKPLPPCPAAQLDVSFVLYWRIHFCYRRNIFFLLQIVEQYEGTGVPY